MHDPLGHAVTTVRQLAADGPFRIGDQYSLPSLEGNEGFEGVIVAVSPVDETWVEIEVAHPGKEGWSP